MLTANNLYNVYWADYFNELIDKNSKIFIGYFKLDEIDINELNFQCSFYFENEYWRLNKIYDYNPSSGEPTKCEFVKLKTSIPFAEDTGVPIKGGVTPLNNNDTAPANTNRTLSNNSYGIKSFGQYNILPTIGDGILVTGSYNNVGMGASNVTILGSSGVTILGGLSNVTLINSNDVEVTESNTSYVNGVAVSTSVPQIHVTAITQSGTDAPTPYLFTNTLVDSTPTWTRSSQGRYVLNATDSFPDSAKIWIGGLGIDFNSGSSVVALCDGANVINGNYILRYASIDGLIMYVYDLAGVLTDLSTLIGTTKICLPEIRVYP